MEYQPDWWVPWAVRAAYVALAVGVFAVLKFAWAVVVYFLGGPDEPPRDADRGAPGITRGE